MGIKVKHNRTPEIAPDEVVKYAYLEDDEFVYMVPADLFQTPISESNLMSQHVWYSSVLTVSKLTKEVVKSRFF